MATVTVPATVITVYSSWTSGGGGGGDPDPDPGTVVDALDVILTSPVDGDVVATNLPEFVVAVDTDNEDDDATFTLTVQYAADDTFTSAVTITEDFDTVDGGAFLTPTTNVPATTYWRAQVSQGATLRSEWTQAASFTVNSTITATTLPVTWTVDDGADRPIHLWHLDPPGPDIGDTVTVYGQGFPDNGHLSFGDLLLDVGSWTLVDAADLDNLSDRTIDGDRVDPEHYEVTFVAPVYDGPGAALSVEA